MAEKDYVKTVYVDGSEPDVDAVHLNNTEDGLDGLYHPEFDDSGTVEGITSFPTFLSTVVKRMNPIAFYKNFKAGMKYVLHTGSLINNGLCTETGKYAADATQLNPNIANTLAWQVAKVNSDLDEHFMMSPDGVTAIQSKSGNTWRRLQVQMINDDIALFKSHDGGATWPEVKTLLTNADFRTSGVKLAEIFYDPLASSAVIKWTLSDNLIYQMVITDQGLRYDRWNGLTWENMWAK
ncbi:hypothetical protein [Enterocloster lavalensis]|uniref:Uncharacterized protein n=1 Tax=Enterocloster lavalensis TaxID=460384 RepID=A0A1I0K9F6_9FIRM|nr:hypothetical protein [Enterocloster lavalensis]SEU20463.1 hypothetical protein SAMN05216313_15428 [Enterocloster lavalensis]